MSNYISSSMSVHDIRQKAQLCRQLLNTSTGKIDILRLLDYIGVYDEHIEVEILVDSDPYFSKDEEAKTDISKRVMYIKESVIKAAANNEHCRATFTIAHEIAHIVLHNTSNTRMLNDNTCYKYNQCTDSEWQADTFAAELLMPFDQCKNMNVEQIYETFNVTISAANVRYSILHPWHHY